MSKHFCNCPVTSCKMHPTNHDRGCDPCIKKNLKLNEMPTCMFLAVHEDVSDVKDYSIKGFVEFYAKHKGAEPQED